MGFRRVVFWAHLGVGVSVGVFVAIMALTGILLTYEAQITHWAEGAYDVDVPESPALSADDMAAVALAATKGQATALVFAHDPAAPVKATYGRGDQALLNPYTGADLGSGETWADGVFGTVTTVHRWLSFEGRSDTGAAITGAANLAFLFILISGLYLWLPRIWKWRALRMNLFFRRGLPNAKARDYNWHHVFGIWALVPLFAVVLSGVVISYPWASNLVFAAYGEEATGMRRNQGSGSGTALVLNAGGPNLQYVLEQAQAHDPDWNTISLTLPKSKGAAQTLRATVDTGSGHQPDRQETLLFSGADGSQTGLETYDDRSPASQARIFLRFLHTGEVYGVIGQTLAGLGTLAALFLVYTGLALSWRRLIWPVLRK